MVKYISGREFLHDGTRDIVGRNRVGILETNSPNAGRFNSIRVPRGPTSMSSLVNQKKISMLSIYGDTDATSTKVIQPWKFPYHVQRTHYSDIL